MAAKKAKKPKRAFVKAEIVDNPGDVWKSISFIASILILLAGVAAAFFGEMQGVISKENFTYIAAIIAALGAAGRYLKQPTVSG